MTRSFQWFWLVWLAGTCACPAPGTSTHPDPFWPGALVDYQGRRLPAGGLQGKVVLLVMFATDNAVAPPLLVGLDGLARDLAAAGLQVVGLAYDEHHELVEPFCRGLELSFPVGLAAEPLRRQVKVLPQLRLYDRRGRLVQVLLGMVEMERLRRAVQRLL